MTLIFDREATAADATGRRSGRHDPAGTIRTDEILHRSTRRARVGLALVPIAIAGVVGLAALTPGATRDRGAPAEPAVSGPGDGHHPEHYATTSAAVEPPLPGVAPAGPFDPATSVANYDASVVVAVVDGALVYTEPGGPVDRHWADLPPGFELRALSTAGTKAALVHHDLDDEGRVVASDVLITERPPTWPADPATVTIHHLDGFVEPEAFATDGRSLFVIDHQAGREPGTYRIRPLDLETGRLEEMLGPDKVPLIEDMNGAGRRQVWGLGDGRLYTLYIRQRDHLHASGRPGTDGFVHILDLDEEWAFCLDLPSTFGKGDLATTALAVGSRTIAVLDLEAGEGGQLAYASTVDRTVTDVIDLPPSFRRTMTALRLAAADESGGLAERQPPVHLAMHGTALAVGVGQRVVWFDGATLEPLVGDSENAVGERIDVAAPLVGLTTLPGNGVLAWTADGRGPEQLTPPRTRP